MLDFCDYIQVYVFTTNHHLKGRMYICFESQSYYNRLTDMLVFFIYLFFICYVILIMIFLSFVLLSEKNGG